MSFNHIVFVLVCCVLFQTGLFDEDGKSNENQDPEDVPAPPFDSHLFVALIDIVFADGSKRTCTGSIIHDHVVITAAHCFLHAFDESIKPELTASFVVIGSKKMFDSGYEQYLPIERILTHPNFRGWTADLSLVYTFAGMTSDKPGKIIPLAGERMSNPVDSNVTVFSWGHCNDDVPKYKKRKTTPCVACSEESDEVPKGRATAGMKSKRSRDQPHQHPSQPKIDSRERYGYGKLQKHRFQTEEREHKNELFYQYPVMSQKIKREREDSEENSQKRKLGTAKRKSRYLPSKEDEIERSRVERDDHKSRYNYTPSPHHTVMGFYQGPDSTESHRGIEPMRTVQSLYKNWRRSMGAQQNKLTVEIFGFVNLAACKKVVENGIPRYEIKNGEVACYSSEEHYLTDEDAGAPAVRHGHLVAVTVGGAHADGDQVAVGMKMSCYCTWISDNLPEDAAEMNCCKNCCDVKSHPDDVIASRNNIRIRSKNKYLYL